MKSYLRYEPNKIFGVITSPTCNVQYDYTGNIAFTGGLSNVNCWNLRQTTHINTLTYKESSYPYITGGEATTLQRCFNKPILAVGYSDGFVRIYNYLNQTLSATLKGHRSAVSSLCFDEDGSTLCSGGCDGDIVLWDMISFTALSRLRGHKDRITGLGFIYTSTNEGALSGPSLISSTKFVVSTSKDTLLKVWNIDVNYCVQTIVGHRCEIWSLAIRNHFHSGGALIITGSADELLRGYSLKSSKTSVDLLDDNDILEYIGCIERQHNSIAGSFDKCASININSNGNLIAAQSSGKIIEIFRIRDAVETKKKYKRRIKRYEAKVQLPDTTMTEAVIVTAGNTDSSDERKIILSDLIEPFHVIRTAVKVRSVDFDPSNTSKLLSDDRCLVGLINNSLEVYQIPNSSIVDVNHVPNKLSVIDVHGHKSDVRGVCISGDGSSIATFSSESIKIWTTKTNACTATCRVSGYCLAIAYAPGSRYVLAGNKEGILQIFDTASGESIFECNPSSTSGNNTTTNINNTSSTLSVYPIWTIQVRPDGKGFMTAGADQKVTFWDFTVTIQGGLSATLTRQLQQSHDVLCSKYSPNKSQDRLLFAVGLLDSTVRVYYDDSMKFFLSLYGHKLPVMCIDISYDSTILISGSADKTIKIWGLDFGDCHRSLYAHEDSVTCVRFQPNTHYFFSSGKDGVCKYWDADRFEQILILPGHNGCLWGLDITSDASQLFSCGQDRSIRMWIRTDDLVFIEEERERALEAQVDKSAGNDSHTTTTAEDDGYNNNNITQSTSNILGIATKSIESVKGGEMLMEALDLVESELPNYYDHQNNEIKFKQQRFKNPLLLGLTPLMYMLRCLRMIKTPDLEQSLLVLPFHFVTRTINILIKLVKNGLDIELCTKCAIYLLRCHQAQLLSTHSLLPEMLELHDLISKSINSYRSLVGMNLAGLKNMKRKWDTQQQDKLEIVN